MTLNFFHVLVLSKAFIENYPNKVESFFLQAGFISPGFNCLQLSYVATTKLQQLATTKLAIFYC